jgi:hypothetical protein
MVITHSSTTQEKCKLKMCIDFRKLNATTKKDPYPLPFTYEVLNTVTGYDAYSFLDGYSRLLWTGLVRGKARKHGYNQAENYKTRQDRTILEN